MGAIYDFEPEKLIIGVIYNDEEVFKSAMEILKSEFGETDAVSEEFSFSKEFSDYYDDELGGEARRKILSFETLVDPAMQADIKTFTNSVESEFSINGNRKINLFNR